MQSNKLFPTGFYIFISVAMICFYSYFPSGDSLSDCRQNTQLYEKLCHKDPLCKLIMELWKYFLMKS
ncbi:unnamed protein product [Musa acuminata subsp. burmannicoides]